MVKDRNNGKERSTPRGRPPGGGRKREGRNPTVPPHPEAVFRALARLFREAAGGRRPGPRISEPILIPFDPAGDPTAFARELMAIFRAHAPSPSGSWTAGRVYCHHCASTACVHAVPPDHLSVFDGYTPTGFPVWTEFLSLLLDAGDPRIDRLFQEGPEVLALYRDRGNLTREQLPVFGKRSRRYNVLGQVAAGYLPLPRGSEGGKCAATFQAVLQWERGRPRLRLNTVGRVTGGEDLAAFLLHHPEPELEGLLAAARKGLETLERRWLRPRLENGEAAGRVLPFLSPVLTRLARGLERCFRRQRRRTTHARTRRSQRPAVGMALKDAGRAGKESFYFDATNRTFIVLGPSRRIHVFGTDGRHVTSMVLNREAVQRRLETRRWRPATGPETSEIRARILA